MFASCRKLKVFNGSELKKRERLDCEIYFLKNMFHEFFKEFLTDQFNYDLEKFNEWATIKYPLVKFYLEEYGNPYPYEERFLQEAPRG